MAVGFARIFFSYLPFFPLDRDFGASSIINKHSGKFCGLLGTSVLRGGVLPPWAQGESDDG